MSDDWYHGERRDPDHYPPPTKKPYCTALPERDNLHTLNAWEYLEERGLSPIIAQSAGWYGAMLDVPRLVIPATASDPDNRYWQARDITHAAKLRYESPHGVSRGDALVVVWPLTGMAHKAAVVEGPLDALAAAEVGYLGIALLGLTPPDPVISFLRALLGSRSVLFVADNGGVAGMAEIMHRTSFADPGKGFYASLVEPYPFKDLAETPIEARRRILGG